MDSGTKIDGKVLKAPSSNYIFDAFDLIEDSIVIFDTGWRYVFVNKAGWLKLERSKDEIIGQNVWKLMPHLKGSQFESACKEAMRTQQKAEIEEYYPHSQRHYRTKFYPSKNFLLLQITDITDLVRAQEINSQLMGDLQDAMEIYWSDENRALRKDKLKHDKE